MSLQGKRIVITGASSGIGKALAIEAARRGAVLCLGARNTEALDRVAKKCVPASVFYAPLDVSDKDNCAEFIAFAATKLGGIDILVNNAGISMRANFAKTDLSVTEQVMQVNFFGAVYCTRFAINHLLQSKGSVIGVSSVAGFSGLPGRTGYSASKFALQGFLEALRTENLKTGLHVMIACPGFTESNIRNVALNENGSAQKESPRDEKKMMSAEEVAVRIWNGTEKRKNLLIMSREGRMSYWLSKFFPAFLRKLTYKHLKAEPDAPF